VTWLPTLGRPVPIIGSGSASAGILYGEEPLAQYNLFTFFKNADGLRIRHTVRGLAEPGGPVVRISETILDPSA
jgi:hypothetical protein